MPFSTNRAAYFSLLLRAWHPCSILLHWIHSCQHACRAHTKWVSSEEESPSGAPGKASDKVPAAPGKASGKASDKVPAAPGRHPSQADSPEDGRHWTRRAQPFSSSAVPNGARSPKSHEQSGAPKKRFESHTVLPCLNAASWSDATRPAPSIPSVSHSEEDHAPRSRRKPRDFGRLVGAGEGT